MTCIVGVKTNKNVYLGGDRYQGNGHYELSNQPKVFKKENILFGNCGSIRDHNLLRYMLEIPHNQRGTLEEYLVRDLIESIRACFKNNGSVSINNTREGIDSAMLIGIENRLFKVSYDYQLAEKMPDYTAEGSGMEVALGSLFTTRGEAPKSRILTALAAAQAHNAYVVSPFDIIGLNDEN